MKKFIIGLLLLLGAGDLYADSQTPNLGLTLPTHGSSGWDTKLNSNFSIIDSSIPILSSSQTFTSTITFNSQILAKYAIVVGTQNTGSYITQDDDGDLWIVANATYSPTENKWYRINTSKYAFGIELIGNGLFPGEADPGLAFWRAAPASNPINQTFGAVGGWELLHDMTAFKDAVIGGNAIEMDGNGTSPYGRFMHTKIGNSTHTGQGFNIFADFSGRDNTSRESWFWGKVDDSYIIKRAPSGGSIVFSTFTRVESNGHVHYPSTATITFTSCGSGPSPSLVTGNDMVGAFTVGGGGITTCQINFGTSWTSVPHCFINDRNLQAAETVIPNQAFFVVNSPVSMTGDTIDYFCIGN